LPKVQRQGWILLLVWAAMFLWVSNEIHITYEEEKLKEENYRHWCNPALQVLKSRVDKDNIVPSVQIRKPVFVSKEKSNEDDDELDNDSPSARILVTDHILSNNVEEQ
jgi:hypothetical protein